MVESARAYSKAEIGPPCYSARALKILKGFKSQPPVPGARVVWFIDITVILPPERSLDMATIETATKWLQEKLE